MKRPLIFGITLFLLAISGFGQTAEELLKARQSEQLALRAYEAKAYTEYLTNMQQANAARPNHPRLIYNLASSYAVNDKPMEALESLERLANMGLSYAIEKDEDFKYLFTSEAFFASPRFIAVRAASR